MGIQACRTQSNDFHANIRAGAEKREHLGEALGWVDHADKQERKWLRWRRMRPIERLHAPHHRVTDRRGDDLPVVHLPVNGITEVESVIRPTMII